MFLLVFVCFIIASRMPASEWPVHPPAQEGRLLHHHPTGSTCQLGRSLQMALAARPGSAAPEHPWQAAPVASKHTGSPVLPHVPWSPHSSRLAVLFQPNTAAGRLTNKTLPTQTPKAQCFYTTIPASTVFQHIRYCVWKLSQVLQLVIHLCIRIAMTIYVLPCIRIKWNTVGHTVGVHIYCASRFVSPYQQTQTR